MASGKVNGEAQTEAQEPSSDDKGVIHVKSLQDDDAAVEPGSNKDGSEHQSANGDGKD